MKGNTVKAKKIVKIFVSTKQTQGQRQDDFSWVPEDELLTPFLSGICGGEQAGDRCGCARSLVGISCFKSTTTAKVVERELTETQLARLFTESANKAGWGRYYTLKAGREVARALLSEAAKFPTGAVVEYRNAVFSKRDTTQKAA
jgi:hypothetical protein